MTSKKLHVIVQAGGLGTRLKHLSWNKPKCLVSVRGKPLLYHLFDALPEAEFTVIGDHLFDVLASYIEVNEPRIKLTLLKTNQKGTVAGIADALALLPADAQTLICWSDILFHDLILPTACARPTIFTTHSFPCRWMINNEGQLEERAASGSGVLGMFYVPSVRDFPVPPETGEFVRWWSQEVREFDVADLAEVEDFGELENVNKANDSFGFCRFFNQVDLSEKYVTKRVVDPNFEDVHHNEVSWYKEASKLGFDNTPNIYSHAPLTMERVVGSHPFEFAGSDKRKANKVLLDIIGALDKLHRSDEVSVDLDDMRAVYVDKTKSRVSSIRRLIPEFCRDEFRVNGIICRNPFSEKYNGMIESSFSNLVRDKFHPIHGDPTFSNTLISESGDVKFIDPRGYFSRPGIYGDKWYDIAKVYYSAAAGYDAFNRRKFYLKVSPGEMNVNVLENSFSSISSSIFDEAFPGELGRIKLLTGLIWLGLTGYARDDVDSVIGSFALGLLWLERGLQAS